MVSGKGSGAVNTVFAFHVTLPKHGPFKAIQSSFQSNFIRLPNFNDLDTNVQTKMQETQWNVP